jgi:hypothetical protein
VAARLFVLLTVLLCLTPVCAFAQVRPAPLQGLEAVTVKVSIVAPPNTWPALLTEARLQTLAELKLRAWALRVVPEEDPPIPGIRPVVELEVTLLETRAAEKLAGYAFVTRLVVKEPGRSLRNGAPVFSELWSQSFLNVSDPKSVIGDMERSTGELVDQFINEWLRTRH